MPRKLKEGQWSLRWDCCQKCGMTEKPHTAKGLCERCYQRQWAQAQGNRCIDCGVEIGPTSSRCSSCSTKVCWENEEYRCGVSKSQRGHIPWNKGRPRSEETKCKISATKKGKQLSGRHKRKIGEGLIGNTNRLGRRAGRETKRKIGKATKSRWANGDFDGNSEALKAAWARGAFDGVFQSPTSIEIQIAAALNIMGIEHQTQYRPDGYSRIYDELVYPNILLEIQGDYFHSEEHFPGIQKRDAEKAQWAEDNGYEFMLIWEHEIKEVGAWAIIAQWFA